MRKFALVLPLICFLFSSAMSQAPASWSLSSDATDKTLKAGDTFKTELKATIEGGWHLYALEQPAGGPIATTIKVTEGIPLSIDGAMSSAKPQEKTDPLFTGDDGKPLL